MDWNDLKEFVVVETGLSRDALHIFVGVGGLLLAALVLRRTLASPLPWLAVLIGELANEAHDLITDGYWDEPMWPGSLRDLIVTLAIPTLLLLLARWAPGFFVRRVAED